MNLSDYANCKMENPVEIGRGWQFVVYDLGNGRVLKKRYPKLDQFFLIRDKQIKKGKSYSLMQILISILRVNKMAKDSNKYMKKLSAKFNLSILGNPVFVGLNSYEQDKVILLKDILNNCSLDDGKRLFDQYILLIHQTWKFGFSDIMFNFLENNGINRNGKLIQSDFGEITSNKNKVLENIKNKKWLKVNCFRTFPEGELKKYYTSIMEREMTAKSLDGLWRYNL
mgnify:CR=1 FL=1